MAKKPPAQSAYGKYRQDRADSARSYRNWHAGAAAVSTALTPLWAGNAVPAVINGGLAALHHGEMRAQERKRTQFGPAIERATGKDVGSRAGMRNRMEPPMKLGGPKPQPEGSANMAKKSGGAYQTRQRDKAAGNDRQGIKAGLTGIGLAVGGGIVTAAGAGAIGVPAIGAGMVAGRYARERHAEAKGQRLKGWGVNDLAQRSRGNGPQRLSGNDAGKFEEANRHYQDAHMGHTAPQEQADAGGSGSGKGWQNPKNQASAQRAKGNNYNGPEE